MPLYLVIRITYHIDDVGELSVESADSRSAVGRDIPPDDMSVDNTSFFNHVPWASRCELLHYSDRYHHYFLLSNGTHERTANNYSACLSVSSQLIAKHFP